MRYKIPSRIILPVLISALAAPACVPGGGLLDDDSVLGQVFNAPQSGASDSGGGAASTAVTSTPGRATSLISGRATDRDSYQLFELSSFNAGDRLALESVQLLPGNSLFTVAVFDQDMNLLARTPSFPAKDVIHVMRRASHTVIIGVRPTYDDSGGDFRIQLTRAPGVPIPAPARQTVYLNFGSGSDIRVHTRSGISFPAFDAAMLGDDYVGTTEQVKRSIVETMRADYAGFDVRIVTSDEGPPPSGAYSTVHFGGSVSGLLGLADNVDRYNSDPTQTAVVFIRGFEPFEVMQLTPEEMGVMIGNVGSHELGHMLGLYHTREPHEVMDTTGTAWELAENQRFDRAALDPSVFPVGMEDSPMILADTVGELPSAPQAVKSVDAIKHSMRMLIRDLSEIELVTGCGLCNSPGL